MFSERNVDDLARTLGACWTKAYEVFHTRGVRFDENQTKDYVQRKVQLASWLRDPVQPYIIIEVVDVPGQFVLPAANAISDATPYIKGFFQVDKGLGHDCPPIFHSAAVVQPNSLQFPPSVGSFTPGRVEIPSG